jgi:hypothetical protein
MINNIGRINTKLYIKIYVSARSKPIWFEVKCEVTTKYGPEVHGNKKRLMSNQITNAPAGEVTPLSNLNIFGLQAVGTSILKYFPYQK